MGKNSALTQNLSDPLADMLTRIRNGCMARKDRVSLPMSRLKLEVVKVLKNEGYIKGFRIYRERGLPVLTILLKFDEKSRSIITDIKRVSKPGIRAYVKRKEVPKVMSGLGVAILSTSQGVMTGEMARRRGSAASFCVRSGDGESRCLVWAGYRLSYPRGSR